MYDIIRKLLITIYFWTWISIGSIVATLVIVPAWFLGMPEEWCRSCIEFFIAEIPTFMMEKIGIWEVKYYYTSVISNGNYIVVANHLSFIDTMFTAQLSLPKVFTWKRRWMYVPFFGWLCWLTGHITIDTSVESRRSAITKSISYLTNNISIIFYPEGTRGNDIHNLLPFKTGAFRISLETGIPILPVTLIGTKQACNGWIYDKSTILIIVDQPIIVTNVEESVNKVRSIMLNNLIKN